MGEPTDSPLHQALQGVTDPELGQNIVDLGLVYAADVDAAGQARVVMTLTTPHCPHADEILAAVRRAALSSPGVREVTVELAWDPLWTPYCMAEPLKRALGLPDQEPEPPEPVNTATAVGRLQRLLGRLWPGRWR